MPHSRKPGGLCCHAAAILAITCTCLAAEPTAVPVNGDFERWDTFDPAPAGWALTNSLFPADWLPESRREARGFALRKQHEPGTEAGSASLYLNGRIVSKQLYGGFRGKDMRLRLWARGENGRFTLYVREYPHIGAPDTLKWVAIAMDHSTDATWREYTTVLSMVPWHGDDAIRLDLDARGVLIDNLRVEILEAQAAPENAPPPPVCAIPPCPRPPEIDGRYSPEEWSRGTHFGTGLMDIRTGLSVSAQNECHIMLDSERLYVCFLAPIPPGGFRCRQTKRDSDVYTDDSFELYIDPAFPGNPGSGIVYQLVVNLSGTVFDMARRRDVGQLDKGWNCAGLQVARGNWQGAIVIELSIPLTDVGVSGTQAEWGLNLCRNFALTQQHTTLTGGAYNDFSRMLQCRRDVRAPALSWRYAGRPEGGRFVLETRLANPGAEQLTYNVELRAGPMAGQALRKSLDLAPGVSETMRLDLMDDTLRSGTFACRVSAVDGTLLFRHDIPFKTEEFHEVQRAFSTVKEARLEYYPIQAKFNVRLPDVSAGEQNRYGPTTLFIESPEGDQRTTTVPRPRFVGSTGHVTIPLDIPANGPHLVRALVQDAEGELLHAASRTVEKRSFPWMDCELGKERVVVPPFTPMRYPGPTTVECWGRRHEFGATGLPSRITSAGQALLDAPVTLLLDSGSGLAPMDAVTCEFHEKADDRCEFGAESARGGLRAELDAWMEYDGCLWYELTLTPAEQVSIDRLVLDVPLRGADSLHAVADAIRSNSTFRLLPDEDGLAWSSKEVANRQVYGNFVPYVWLGTPSRGLCWFADSDRGWVNDPEHACVDVIRDGNRVTLRLNLITGPCVLEAPRRIAFGLMATPTRPRLTGAETHPNANYTASFGGFFNFGLVSLDPHISRLVLRQHASAPAAFHVYTAGQQYPLGDPEFDYLSDELAREPFAKYTLELKSKKYRLKGDASGRYISRTVSWSPERVDYALHHIDRLMDLGVRGVYLDNSYPSFTSNIQTQAGGYVREDGHVQAACHILLTREYVKRCTVLAHLKGLSLPRFSVHATDAMAIPAFAFADGFLAGEMSVPKNQDHMDVYNAAKRRIMFGTHWGPTPSALTMLGYGDGARDPKRNRAMLGMIRLFDMRLYWNSGRNEELWTKLTKVDSDFGTSAPDSVFVGYWQSESQAVALEPREGLEASFFVRPGRAAMVTVTNFARAEGIPEVTLDFRGFDSSVVSLSDAETGAVLEPLNGGYTVPVAPRDFRLLHAILAPAKP